MRKRVIDPILGMVWDGGDPGECRSEGKPESPYRLRPMPEWYKGKTPVLTEGQHVSIEAESYLRPAFDGKGGWVRTPTGRKVAECWRDQTGDKSLDLESGTVYVTGRVPVAGR